jgi:Fe-S-cluster containining protein
MPDPDRAVIASAGTPATEPRAEASLRSELERGLQFANVMLTVNQEASNEAVVYVQAIVDLLIAKGIIRQPELEQPLEQARREIAEAVVPRVRLGETGDKYAAGQSIDVDCASRLHLCEGRCCTLKFYLTKQDLDEGVVRWDYGNPYWIRQGTDGYCVHLDREKHVCGVYEKRPYVCRRYECSRDKRIWIDFEQRIPAPARPFLGDSPVALAEVALRNTMQPEQRSDGTGDDAGE